jgi:hypothetical protein
MTKTMGSAYLNLPVLSARGTVRPDQVTYLPVLSARGTVRTDQVTYLPVLSARGTVL